MSRILSGDAPSSRALAIALGLIVLALFVVPLAGASTRSLNMAAKMVIFIPLAASFCLLLGYTGIVSFAHTVFFGIGGYAVGLALRNWGPEWSNIAIGTVIGVALSALASLLIALLSLRVRAIYFAMVTLVAALVVSELANRLTWLTGGQDGILYKLPASLSPATTYFVLPILETRFTGRTLAYYVCFLAAALAFLAMLRLVNSPFGRVLQAIRENEFRAQSFGYPTVRFRTVTTIVASSVASLAGSMYAIWLGYIGPGTTLSLTVLTDILLIVVIGGSGSLYGAIVGTALLISVENYLQQFLARLLEAVTLPPALAAFISPDRWLLWLGILYVLCIYHFPNGIAQPRKAGQPG